jgi:uncharacterized repeat protein (TIGR04052 family)
MTLVKKILTLAFAAAAISVTANAQVPPQDPPTHGAEPVKVSFSANVGDRTFHCGEVYDGIGLAKTRITGTDLRFFVSNIELLTGDGKSVPMQLDQDGTWQYKSVALLDFEDGTGSCSNGNAATHTEVSGTAPAGDYVGIRFTLGVPFDLDHIDAASAPSPLNTSAMFWVWQSGYKFLRAEVKIVNSPLMPVSASQAQASPDSMKRKTRSSGFPMHLGSTGCSASAVTSTPSAECEHPNRPVIVLSKFDAQRDVVVFDLAKLLAGVDITGGPGGEGAVCMSSPKSEACAGPMQALGIAFRNAPASEQVVFSVKERD